MAEPHIRHGLGRRINDSSGYLGIGGENPLPVTDEASGAVVVSNISTTQQWLVTVTGIESAVLFLLTAYLLHRFASRVTPWWVKGSVFIGWFLGFSLVLMLPLDLAFTKSNSNRSSLGMVWFWETNFWASTVMAYVIFPLSKGIVSSGAFTFPGKVRDALCSSLAFYVVILVVGAVTLGWVIATGLTMDVFLGFVMALSNIYGLLLITVLMSYGLVEVPRHLWKVGNYSQRLRALHLKVGTPCCILATLPPTTTK